MSERLEVLAAGDDFVCPECTGTGDGYAGPGMPITDCGACDGTGMLQGRCWFPGGYGSLTGHLCRCVREFDHPHHSHGCHCGATFTSLSSPAVSS